MKKVIRGKTVAPYSPAVIYDGKLVFVSGQIPANADLSFKEQAKSALENLKAVLEKAGASLDTVLKARVYLKDMNNFADFNDVYKTYFPKDPPARAAMGVAALPLGVQVEIEATAYIKK